MSLVTNQGRHDDTTVGTAAAVMSYAWHDHHHHDQAFELGEGATEYDIDLFGISLAGRCILSYLRAGGQARQFIVLSRSQSAIIVSQNTGQYRSTP